MIQYALRRLFQTVPLVLAVVIALFLLIEAAPGDPISALVGDFPASDRVVAELTEKYQLNEPVHVRLGTYISHLAQGDLGFSTSTRQPVTTIIWSRLPNTLLLAGAGVVISTVVGVGLGVLAARTRYSFVDTSVSVGSLVGYAIPGFWLGQLLLLVFTLGLGLFPTQGMRSVGTNASGIAAWGDVAWHLVLPAIAVAAREIGINTRITRGSMRATLGGEYVVFLRAMGLSERRIAYKHGLRNALIPVTTVVGYNFGYALAGTILIETVFGWPGVGRLVYEAVLNRDNAIVIGVFITIAVMVVIVNLATDLLYGFLDPRIRTGRQHD